MFGGSAGELHRQSGNGAAVGHAFAGFDVASVFYRTGQVFGDVPDGRQRYRLAQYVHETANHYFRIVKQGVESLISGVLGRDGAHQFRVHNGEYGIQRRVSEPDLLVGLVVGDNTPTVDFRTCSGGSGDSHDGKSRMQ